jgi:double-stranded uracil-DNA glycosylase
MPKPTSKTKPAPTPRSDGLVPDLVGPGLLVLFCGINPGQRSGELGLHFARAGNRFWKLLHAGGFTDHVMAPDEQSALPHLGVGITNLVERATTAASELRPEELREGARRLEHIAQLVQPRCVAVLGLQAYRTAFKQPRAGLGLQESTLGGVPLWLLPNPSGLQAKYQLPEMTEMFAELHRYVANASIGGQEQTRLRSP